jgi:predicted metal-dependent hydrolase
MSLKAVELFVKQNEPWLEKSFAKLQAKTRQNTPGGSNADYLAFKETAYAIATAKLSEIDGGARHKIAIKNAKTLWGSCTRQGTLNFNYKIALLPKEVANYIVVHEFCHLKEFNHSDRFWRLVEGFVPNYKALRKLLK